MALLKKIKEKLGFGSDSSDGESGETTVTVEQDVDEGEPNDRSEAAGTGTADAAVDETAVTPDEEEVSETEDAGEDVLGDDEDGAAADEDGTADDGFEAGEVDTDDQSGGEGVAAVDDEPDAADETEADEGDDEPDAADETEADEGNDEPDGEPVHRIKGIGPAYGERLGKIGIETVEDLAAADPAEVAEGASIGEKRAVKWIDRAKEF